MRRFRYSFTLRVLAIACLASLAPSAARAESEMSFYAVQLSNGTEVISARGQITDETPDRFIEFLDENPGVRAGRPVVFLDSPGGRVLASTEFGKLLRRVGAAVVVARVGAEGMTNAQCFSACVYALMGASKRVIPSSSLVGIHRMFAYEADVDASGEVAVVHRRYDNGTMKGYLQHYSSEMGVNPGLIADAEHVSSDNLRILSKKDIRRYRLGVSR